MIGFYQLNPTDDKVFYNVKDRGSYSLIIKGNTKVKFKYSSNAVKPFNIGTWTQSGDTVYLEYKKKISDRCPVFIFHSSYYFDALVPLDSSYSYSLNLIKSIEVNLCKSDKIHAIDSLIEEGAEIDPIEHPRTIECIFAHFHNSDVLISPNDIYRPSK